jgi:hypothetical protein
VVCFTESCCIWSHGALMESRYNLVFYGVAVHRWSHISRWRHGGTQMHRLESHLKSASGWSVATDGGVLQSVEMHVETCCILGVWS